MTNIRSISEISTTMIAKSVAYLFRFTVRLEHSIYGNAEPSMKRQNEPA